MMPDTNKFKVTSYDEITVKQALCAGFLLPQLPDGFTENDCVARVVGLCVSGPNRGRRVHSFHFVSEQMIRDTAHRQFIESDALEMWGKLPPYDEEAG